MVSSFLNVRVKISFFPELNSRWSLENETPDGDSEINNNNVDDNDNHDSDDKNDNKWWR